MGTLEGIDSHLAHLREYLNCCEVDLGFHWIGHHGDVAFLPARGANFIGMALDILQGF